MIYLPVKGRVSGIAPKVESHCNFHTSRELSCPPVARKCVHHLTVSVFRSIGTGMCMKTPRPSGPQPYSNGTITPSGGALLREKFAEVCDRTSCRRYDSLDLDRRNVMSDRTRTVARGLVPRLSRGEKCVFHIKPEPTRPPSSVRIALSGVTRLVVCNPTLIEDYLHRALDCAPRLAYRLLPGNLCAGT